MPAHECPSCGIHWTKPDADYCERCLEDKAAHDRAGLTWVPWSERGVDRGGRPLSPSHPWNRGDG